MAGAKGGKGQRQEGLQACPFQSEPSLPGAALAVIWLSPQMAVLLRRCFSRAGKVPQRPLFPSVPEVITHVQAFRAPVSEED